MFGSRNGKSNEEEAQDSMSANTTNLQRVSPESSQMRTASPVISPRSSSVAGGRRPSIASEAERKLTVGKGLSLAGEITSCDVLVVEGKVEAKLTDGKLLEITESGQFRGSVEIENADIAGRYDGQLVVHGRLTVRATGRISGTVKYGELEVNAGGQIIGEIQVTGGGAAAAGASGFKSAAKFAAAGEEEEATTETRKNERKSA